MLQTMKIVIISLNHIITQMFTFEIPFIYLKIAWYKLIVRQNIAAVDSIKPVT